MYSNSFENDIPSDALDAMADYAYEQEQAMREEFYEQEQVKREQEEQEYLSDIAVRLMEGDYEDEDEEWDGIDEISAEERNACDHYNERYQLPTND